MRKRSHQFAFIALVFWLLSNWAGAHGHFCFDGQEPQVSVHIHLDGHAIHDHHPNEAHQDTDIELGQSVLAKLSKVDLVLGLIAALSLSLLVLPAAIFCCIYRAFYPLNPLHARPLLRAPPLTA